MSVILFETAPSSTRTESLSCKKLILPCYVSSSFPFDFFYSYIHDSLLSASPIVLYIYLAWVSMVTTPILPESFSTLSHFQLPLLSSIVIFFSLLYFHFLLFFRNFYSNVPSKENRRISAGANVRRTGGKIEREENVAIVNAKFPVPCFSISVDAFFTLCSHRRATLRLPVRSRNKMCPDWRILQFYIITYTVIKFLKI